MTTCLFYQAMGAWVAIAARVVQAVRPSFNFSRVCTSREKFLDGWTSWTSCQPLAHDRQGQRGAVLPFPAVP